ncbi:hypothetical protein [Nitrosospira multiformis]|uniref:Uncharacterized protein n=1 Tax=Nitrosospira multiformis TaxID=1231 RepID=A0A1I7IX60_9PROT|nr:hypothetical protein [Nitrosospira multiformis]SFU77520.1 hypothetical protein SAMN05216417_13010 [Nitrosospira multiformis]
MVKISVNRRYLQSMGSRINLNHIRQPYRPNPVNPAKCCLSVNLNYKYLGTGVIGRESDGTTRTQAEEFIEKARQDAKSGRLNLPKRRKIVLGFEEAAERYLAKLEQEGGKDLLMKRRRLSLHVVPFFKGFPLSKITSFDIERYKKHRFLKSLFVAG